MADSERLNRTLAHIEANLSLWDQTQWAVKTECGTAYCFAGWSLQLEGIRVCLDDCDGSAVHVHRADLPSSIRDRVYDYDSILSVSQVARVVLDLEPAQAWNLFCGSNTLKDLQHKVQNLTKQQREEQKQ